MPRLAIALTTAFIAGFVPDGSAQPGAPATASLPGDGGRARSVFMFYQDRLVSSDCNASPVVTIAIAGAYGDAARPAYPIRGALRNGVVLTVRWQESASGPSPPDPGTRVVSEVLEVGAAVECNATGIDRPFLGTRWAEMQGDDVRERGWSLLFTPDEFRVFDGCNSAAGPYQLAGSRVTLSELMKTLKACPFQTYDPPGVNRHPPRDHDWLEADMPYTFAIRGRVMELRPALGEPRIFIAREWD